MGVVAHYPWPSHVKLTGQNARGFWLYGTLWIDSDCLSAIVAVQCFLCLTQLCLLLSQFIRRLFPPRLQLLVQ